MVGRGNRFREIEVILVEHQKEKKFTVALSVYGRL
jgi:hypothetical protein